MPSTRRRPSPAIQVRQLSKSFRAHAVLKGVDLDLPAHALTALIGRSGSGKSTLLRCLNGLETPDGGSIALAGVTRRFPDDASDQVKQHAVRAVTGMVFQQFHLFPHLNILQNLELAPRVAQRRGDKALLRAEAQALLAKVGLSFHAEHFPAQLSGGQQQRAAIARALMRAPQVLLFDEPTSSLDPQLSAEVLEVMRALKREGMTQVMVTHELSFARRYADHVVFLEDGVVVEQGSAAQVFGRPQDARTRTFVKGGGL